MTIPSMPGSSGPLAYGHASISLRVSNDTATCQLKANNAPPDPAPWIYCEVRRGNEISFASEYFLWTFADPVTIRVQLDPTSRTFTFYGNTHLLATFAADQLSTLSGSQVSFQIETATLPPTDFLGQFMEVRLSQ